MKTDLAKPDASVTTAPSTAPGPNASLTEVVSCRRWMLMGVFGAYLNAVAYGFVYGEANHDFDLPLVNWLLDPSLYPHDPITQAFTHFPTIFWPTVGYLSKWSNTEAVLFIFFLITKLLFFTALARIVGTRVNNVPLVGCILAAVALSPFLNDLTPLGISDILNSVETHTSLALGLLLWAGCFLLEGRWLGAAVLCTLAIYIDALFFVFMLFAFVAFAALDWEERRGRIFLAALIGGAISLPWVLTPGVLFRNYPQGYVEALVAFFPLHLRLSSHEPYDWISGAGIIIAAGLMVLLARKAGSRRHARLELLAASFLLPVLLGALFGEFFLTPTLARLQLLRADSFLLLYSILLIELYGAELLLSSEAQPAATTFLFGTTALLLPLSDLAGLLWPLLIAMILWARFPKIAEDLCQAIARSWKTRLIGLCLLLAGVTLAGLPHADWSTTLVILITIIGGSFFIYDRSGSRSHFPARVIATAASTAALLMVAAGTVPKLSSFWNPLVDPSPREADWRGVQQWAKTNTSQNTQFLVPTYPGGFRAFSERSSWGEWKDGTAIYHYPPFADVYTQRMQALGYPWPGTWVSTEGSQANLKRMEANYKRLPWEQLLALARENHLSYIIQFREVSYPQAPIFANDHYAVYKVR